MNNLGNWYNRDVTKGEDKKDDKKRNVENNVDEVLQKRMTYDLKKSEGEDNANR